MNLVLIGFMGVGKTSVGQRLAERLGWPFVDTDALIEEAYSMTVSEIFEQFGEPLFRQMERTVVEFVSKKNDCVIATGGGVVLDPENILRLKTNGVLIHLDLSPETISDRIGPKLTRPLLQKKGPPLQTLETLYRMRSPLYRSCCDHRVDREGLDVEETVDRIMEVMGDEIVKNPQSVTPPEAGVQDPLK
jgi:shikimate kinase